MGCCPNGRLWPTTHRLSNITSHSAAALQIGLACLKEPTNSDETRAHSRIARGCLIAPVDDQQLLKKAVAATRLSVTHGYKDDGQKNHFQNGLAMAEYRSGNYAKAEELLTAVVEYAPEGKQMGNTAMLFRSMTRHHLGRHAEAQTDLKTIEDRFEALSSLSRNELPFSAEYGSLHIALVYREAKALLDEPRDPTAKTD